MGHQGQRCASSRHLACFENTTFRGEWIMVSPNYRCRCRTGASHHVHRAEEMRLASETGQPLRQVLGKEA
jgi:hypothetical protein